MDKKESFSVITVTRGDLSRLLALKSSLKLQQGAELQWQIVLTTPYSKELVDSIMDSWISITHASGLSVNAARNLGAKLSQHPWLIFLDDDVSLPRPFHLEDRLSLHQQAPDNVLGGGYLSPSKAGFWDRAYNTMCNLWLQRFRQSRNGDILLGGNFSCSREIFSKVHLLEDVPWGGEETLSFLEWKKKGVDLKYHPQLSVEHWPRKTIKSYFATAWRQGRAKPAQYQVGVRPSLKSLIRLFFCSGRYGVAVVLYWMVGEFARFKTSGPMAPKRRAHLPSDGKSAETCPARNI